MARHHTKDKGDLAVAKVHASLVERGAIVLLPLTEHAPFDLVAYLGGRFYRVQVKYRKATCGSVCVQFVSSWADRHGVHSRPMPRDEVDVVAIYCPETSLCYYVDPAKHRHSVKLRIEPAKNRQVKGVLPAHDFLVMPPASVLRGLVSGERATFSASTRDPTLWDGRSASQESGCQRGDPTTAAGA